MVAFITSIIITVVLVIPFFIMKKRRPVGTPLTWGEAMVAATWAFFLMFWVYGVVPHQWLTMADAEWNWRRQNWPAIDQIETEHRESEGWSAPVYRDEHL